MTFYELDFEAFRSAYPAFSEEKVSEAQLSASWDEVKVLLGDGEGNFPYPEQTIKAILFAALCHLLTLKTSSIEQPSRIASATEGSVSTSFENLQVKTDSGAWWNLTKCGALFWAMTMRYRTGCKLYHSPKFHPWG